MFCISILQFPITCSYIKYTKSCIFVLIQQNIKVKLKLYKCTVGWGFLFMDLNEVGGCNITFLH